MRKVRTTYLPASLLLAFLAMILATCGGGGDGSGPGTTHPPTESVIIKGTVPGTVAIAYYASTGIEAARSVASGTPKTFSLSVTPGDYYLMFIENEGTPTQRSFAFRNVTGGNVFTCKVNTTLDLGVLVFNNYPGTAVPLIDPISGNKNVTETFMPEASFSPGAGEWIATRKFVNSTCPGHSPGTTVTENVTIAHGFGIVTYTPAGTTDTAGGPANVNTAILTSSSSSALVTMYLTMQSDGSLAGTYSKVGYGGGCSEDAAITAVRGTSPPSPPPAATLTGLSILGPSVMNKYGTATYLAMADFSDHSTSTVTPTWSVNSQMASISASGVLSCQTIATDLTVTVSATYSAGGSTKTATKDVTIASAPTFPFRPSMLLLTMYFEETTNAGGDYDSSLFKFNDDSSFRQYRYGNPPGTSEYVTGTWSIGASGEAILNYGAGKTVTVMLLEEPFISGRVLVDGGTGTPRIVTWKWAGPGPFPFDGALLPGTYVNQYGDTWVFSPNGTGSTTGEGGSTFTWSVDAGIIKVVFPNGFVGWMYQTPSANTWTSYPEIAWAYVVNTPTGDFHFYYGGMILTRQ